MSSWQVPDARPNKMQLVCQITLRNELPVGLRLTPLVKLCIDRKLTYNFATGLHSQYFGCN